MVNSKRSKVWAEFTNVFVNSAHVIIIKDEYKRGRLMRKFDTTVPFDPGFSAISFSFIENIEVAKREFSQLKVSHQKKFWLMKYEPVIVEFIEKSTAFYLGCMLWGSFIHFRFKDSPKAITGNTTDELNTVELKELDCATEAKAILEYIKSFDRDCKYFLGRSAKIAPVIKEILENYVEFAGINNNFIGVKTTNDIKIPNAFTHFEKMTPEQLDELCQNIYSVIDSNKIENLLKISLQS